MDIGKNLSLARVKAGLTQEQAAEALGVSRQTLSNWENDKTEPDISFAQSLAVTYGVDLTDLLYDGKSEKLEYPLVQEESASNSICKMERGIAIGYLSLWLVCVLFFWMGGSSGGFALFFGIFINGLGLPIFTAVAALLVGLMNCWRSQLAYVILVFGASHVLLPYFTYTLANMLTFWHFKWPDFQSAWIGICISAVMIGLGSLIRLLVDKIDTVTAKFGPVE